MLDLLNWYSSFLYSYLTFTSLCLSVLTFERFPWLKKYIFIFDCWVFVAVCRLSSCSEQGLLSGCGALLLLWSRGFSCIGFSSSGTVGSTVEWVGSRAWTQELWRTGFVVPRQVALPRPGIKTVSPAFARPILNHWTTREAWDFLDFSF